MLCRKKIINKDKKIIENSNLKDYEKEYKKFSWKEAEKELAKSAKHILNAAYITIDINTNNFRKNKIALFWEGEDGTNKKFTFSELSSLSNRIGNLLKENGVRKKDRVFIFLPRIPELYFSFLGILKIGAIGGILFPAFEKDALYDRLNNSDAKVLITTKELSSRIKAIRSKLPKLKKLIIIDENFSKKLQNFSDKLEIQNMGKNDPAFMFYTSATGNTPVCGITHSHLSIVQQIQTASWVLDFHEYDTYWCTGDPGWITGTVYGLLAPWALGVSQLVYEGRFDAKKWLLLIEKYKISILYTAPTALRMVQLKEALIKDFNLSSLRYIASVGEALSPDLIEWSVKKFHLPIHDTWWQTETGAMMIANYPCLKIKPGSMGKPIPGIKTWVIDEKGNKLKNKVGNLVFKPDWPSIMIGIWKNNKLYKSYFSKEFYISGDLAYEDNDGYIWFVGRAKDIIKTAGERIGPFEVESALSEHPNIHEAGVIGKPDKLRGEIIKAFIVLKEGIKPSEKLKEDIVNFVKKNLAGHAYPREIEFIDKLPKNRSGKIVRRILKAKELGLPIGDTSTLDE